MAESKASSAKGLHLAPDAEIEACLRGERIYGDSLGEVEIARWHADEREAYSRLGAGDRRTYDYRYHALNALHGYRHLPAGQVFPRVLAVGGAHGDELLPIAGRLGHVTILDPSKAFSGMWVGGTPVTRVRPDPCGILPMGDGSFDLITCFGVLHHIPNVSFVLRELWRVLDRDGIMLLREPTVSMGDWRKTRGNLTKHERGLHLPLLREAIGRAGFGVAREAPVMFPAWRRACQRVGVEPFSVAWATRVDQALCRLFAWQRSYHPTSVAQKLRPSSAYFVLRRTP